MHARFPIRVCRCDPGCIALRQHGRTCLGATAVSHLASMAQRRLFAGISGRAAARIRLQLSLPFELRGSSMIPVLWPSERVRIRGHTARALAVGDIVAVDLDDTVLLHRIIAVSPDGMHVTTRGDACNRADPDVSVDRILGLFDGLDDRTRDSGTGLPFLRSVWNRCLCALLRSTGIGRNGATAVGRILCSARRLVRGGQRLLSISSRQRS